MTPEEKRRYDAWKKKHQEEMLRELCDELGFGRVIDLVGRWMAEEEGGDQQCG